MPKETAERPLIGRQAEKLIMLETLQSDKSELIAIYGRRRVGKTYLIRQVFQNKISFELSGSVDAPMEIQLTNFAKQLDSRMTTGIKLSVPANWPEAFDMLKGYLTKLNKEGKKVIFFDELPWLDTMHSGFLSALDYFWNSWCTKRSDIVMVVCGSAASWMIEKVIQNKGGLHNRITRKIRLLPFTLTETRAFLQYKQIALDEHQIAQLYMVAGGVAYYLDAVQRGKSATQNIDLLCFHENGMLRHEFEQLYHSLFRNAHRHIAIIRALSKKNIGLTRSEIAQAVQMQSGGNLSQILKELEESGFIMASRQPHRKLKDMVYRLTDEYSCFYLRFIEP
ncbi:MAG: AAA family ATPase, partial [Chitinophagaceae bacterium]|nr:AAA family ATPase [Chitinophagaceae bacterium]